MSGTPLAFAGADYAAGRAVQATYTFNSYRLTYRYTDHQGSRTTAWVGVTAKIRDAVIALQQDGVSSRKDDLGLVPLLHVRAGAAAIKIDPFLVKRPPRPDSFKRWLGRA